MIREIFWQVITFQLDVDQVHGQCKFICVQCSVLINVSKSPYLQNLLKDYDFTNFEFILMKSTLAKTGLGNLDLIISFLAIDPLILPLTGPRELKISSYRDRSLVTIHSGSPAPRSIP